MVQRRVEAPKEEAEDDGGRDESTMRRLLPRVWKIYRKVFRGKFLYKSFRESQKLLTKSGQLQNFVYLR